MDKIATVAAREFIETVRTKAFFISVVVTPALIMGLVFGAEWFSRVAQQETVPARVIALIDETGLIAGPLGGEIEKHNQEFANRPFELREVAATAAESTGLGAQLESGDLYAYVRIPAEIIDGDAPYELARTDSQFQAGSALRSMIRNAVVAVRFEQADPPVDLEYVTFLQREVRSQSIDMQTGQLTADDELVRVLIPFAFMFVLFMGTMQISYGLLSSLVEEKSSRVVEVLLSAVSPVQLMAGKICGAVMVGTVLLLIWGGVGFSAAQARGYGHLVSGELLGYAALYFVPGFLLLSAFLGAVGSACNTIKEAQHMASPIALMNIVPLVLWLPISQNAGSLFSVVLSYIPPITPFVMILRICSDPDLPLWQVITTQIMLWASVIAMIWAAGKVFRIGVLMYGKPPSLRELLRWVRYA